MYSIRILCMTPRISVLGFVRRAAATGHLVHYFPIGKACRDGGIGEGDSRGIQTIRVLIRWSEELHCKPLQVQQCRLPSPGTSAGFADLPYVLTASPLGWRSLRSGSAGPPTPEAIRLNPAVLETHRSQS